MTPRFPRIAQAINALFGSHITRPEPPNDRLLQGNDDCRSGRGTQAERSGIDAMIPSDELASYVGGGGAERFKAVGEMMISCFKAYCDLKPDERVLEVGCGVGRIAIPLTQYLTTGSYDGFDIVKSGIEWCQQKITTRHPNFRFFTADVYNGLYNPEGTVAASEYVFPFGDDSFDFVFLTSVFTHMLPPDFERYATEIRRVLRPGGRCFCTAYIISREARTHVADGTSRILFSPSDDGYWSSVPEHPEQAVAYSEEYFNEVFNKAGLQITLMAPGEWWKHEFTQDMIIGRKPSSASC